tara:strand:+ start:203 stop:322 length:120 start_codon:yes stop_codon:yes gene_type:complete
MIKYNKKEVDKAIKANNKFNKKINKKEKKLIHALLKGRR